MQALIEYASYVPHGYCLFWQPWLVALYAGSDLLIFGAYSLIPLALLTFLRRRPDLRFRGLVALFAAFILLCGITHLISVVTLWVPVYPLHGLAKLVTGVVSMSTAIVLFGLIPKLVAIPSPHQLEAANAQLRAEVAAHEATLAQLREARRDLEARVEARTAELSEANRQLSVATREAVHRGRNLLSVVSSLARQTARGAGDVDVDTFLPAFLGRLEALSNATSAIMNDPSRASAPLEAVIRRQLEPVLLTFGDRVALRGPEVEVGAEAAQQLALALHELATNAMKFGALAAPGGSVRVEWEIAGKGASEALKLTWREMGAATRELPEGDPQSGGFGTILLMRAVPAMLHGAARRTTDGAGLRYELRAPLSEVSPKPRDAAEDPGVATDLTDAVWSSA